MSEAAQSDEEFAGLNAAGLLAKLGGDKGLLLEIIELFRSEAPILLNALRERARSGNAPDVALAAHVLKGSAANFGRNPLYELTRAIEHGARAGDLSALEEQMARLELTAGGFLQALAQMEREVRA